MLESLLVAGNGPDAKRAELAVERLGIDLCAPPVSDDGSQVSLEEVLSTAERTGAKGIWAGGLNPVDQAQWAEQTRARGLVFVGPNQEALTVLESRVRQRAHARLAGMAVLPNTEGLTDLAAAKTEAMRLGYPLWLSPDLAGSDSKSTRVASEEELEAALGASPTGDLILEAQVPHARFLEVTVIRDQSGGSLRLPECETSLRDAHGTMVCEMPSAAFHFHPNGDELREGLRECADAYAAEVNLVGALTLLFLLGRDGKCWFSEARAGSGAHSLKSQLLSQVDPLEQEIRVAGGESVTEASQLAPFGHTLSARLRADESAKKPIELVFPPQSIRKARVEQLEVGANVDLAQIASHGATRHGAILGLDRMLAGTQVAAGSSNRDRLRELINDESFRAGLYDASFRQGHDWADS